MGNNITIPSSNTNANIIKTIASGNVSDVLKYFDGPPDKYYGIVHDNLTPLHAAINNTNDEVLEMLLSMGFPILPNTEGNTPLHVAAMRNDIAKINLLLDSAPHSSSSMKTLSKTTANELKDYFNTRGERPYDLATDDYVKSLIKPPLCTTAIYEGDRCRNNVLQGVCRLNIIRPIIHISLTGDDAILFSFPKDKTGSVHRLFMIEISSHLSLSGPLVTATRFIKYDEVSEEIIDHNILSTYTIQNISVNFIFGFSKMMYLYKTKEHNILQYIFEGLCCMGNAVRKRIEEYLIEILPTIKATFSEFSAPSMILQSQDKMSPSAPKSVEVYTDMIFLKNVLFVDDTKKIQNMHIGRTSTKRCALYVAICSDGGLCEWLSDTTLSVIYKNENNIMRVYRLDFKEHSTEHILTLSGPMAEISIVKTHPKIEHAIVLKNASVDDVTMAMTVVLMCSGGIVMHIQNPKRKIIYDTFDLLRDVFSGGSKLDSAYLAAQLDKVSTVSISQRIEPSNVC